MATSPAGMKRCPSCRSANPVDAIECDTCGYRFDAKHTPPASMPRSTQPAPAPAPPAASPSQPTPVLPRFDAAPPVDAGAGAASANPDLPPRAADGPEVATPASSAEAASMAAGAASAKAYTAKPITPKAASKTAPAKPSSQASSSQPTSSRPTTSISRTKPTKLAPSPRRSLLPVISLAVIALAAIAGVLLVIGGVNGGRPGVVPTPTVAVRIEMAPTEAGPGLAPAAATIAPIEPTPSPAATEMPTAQPTVEPTVEPTFAPTETPAPTQTAAPPEAKKYTVKAGDSCYKISREFDISIDDLIRINKLRSNCFILPGQELIVSQ